MKKIAKEPKPASEARVIDINRARRASIEAENVEWDDMFRECIRGCRGLLASLIGQWVGAHDGVLHTLAITVREVYGEGTRVESQYRGRVVLGDRPDVYPVPTPALASVPPGLIPVDLWCDHHALSGRDYVLVDAKGVWVRYLHRPEVASGGSVQGPTSLRPS